jgi:hypothetical protein
MDLVAVQVCRTTDGWSPVQIESGSTKGLHYTVLVNPHVPVQEFVCDCKGFEFRGQCKHQHEAANKSCWWPMVLDLKQTDSQRKEKICPQCGGPTKWEMVDADEA